MVFVLVAMLSMAGIAIVGAAITASLGQMKHVDTLAAEADAFHAAEAGLSVVVERAFCRCGDHLPLCTAFP